MKKASIIGAGIPAWACAATLVRHGWEVFIHGNLPTMPPILVISPDTIDDLSAIPRHSSIRRFSGHRIDRLEFIWGDTNLTLNERGWAVPGDRFLREVVAFIRSASGDSIRWIDRPIANARVDSSHWCVDTDCSSCRCDDDGFYFGNRSAFSTLVELRSIACQRTSIMEATAEGWIYLAPVGDQLALLQGIMPTGHVQPRQTSRLLLSRATRIPEVIGPIVGDYHVSPAAPFLSSPLLGTNRLCVGRAALEVDPISGDGVGCSVSSAILAAAVMDAIETGENLRECLSFYRTSIRNTMLEHLKACSQLYDLGVFSQKWCTEIRRNLDAEEWLCYLVGKDAPPRYWLNGYRLERLERV